MKTILQYVFRVKEKGKELPITIVVEAQNLKEAKTLAKEWLVPGERLGALEEAIPCTQYDKGR